MNNEPVVLAPASLPQEQFLSSDSTITLYAGAMGAGKSFAIVLNMVKFAAKKNSTIVCFRRTMPELRAPGGIWQEAVTIFKQMWPDCKVRTRDLEIYVPETNSVLKFQSLQYQADVDKALGAQFSAIFFDEAITFDPFDQFILPLLGRLRNAKVDYTPQMFWATNPSYDHGIYHWIKDFYLDEHGIPLKERSNVERYFVLKDNQPIWFDDKQEACEFCDTLPAPGGNKVTPRTFRAIRAHVTDNIPLMLANPDYIANLQAMPEIRRRKYLDGSWTAREEEAGYFKRDWCKVVPFPNMGKCIRVRSWDQAASPPSSAVPDPDWTRGTLVSKDANTSIYTVENVKSMRDRPHKVEELIYETARTDPDGTIVILPIDPGQAGIGYANTIKTKLAEMGIYCKLLKTNKSKLARFLPFSSLSEARMVEFVKAEWNEEAFKELENFSGERTAWHDDIADTLASAVIALNQGTTLPTMQIPNISIGSSVATPGSFLQSYSSTSTPFSLPQFNISSLR